MKMIMKIIGLIVTAFLFAAVFAACEGNVKDNVRDADSSAESMADSVESGAEKAMTDIETSVMNAASDVSDALEAAKSKVADMLGMDGGISSEKVREAVKYIGDHIDDNVGRIGNDVKEKFVYYAEYLRQVGSKLSAAGHIEIMNLGDKAYSLAERIYADKNDDVSGLRTEIKELVDKISKNDYEIIESSVEAYNK
ncbi:MAG: hypothetical protein IJT91_07235 [Clostridia bacterium]|nr:hypothetical protein [Clostridia bacterium]